MKLDRRRKFINLMKEQQAARIAIYPNGKWEIIPLCQIRPSAAFHYYKDPRKKDEEEIVELLWEIETKLKRLAKVSIPKDPF